jgi:hypothetical protein
MDAPRQSGMAWVLSGGHDATVDNSLPMQPQVDANVPDLAENRLPSLCLNG